MNKLKFIKYFESFTKDKLEELKSNKQTYLKRKLKEDIQYDENYRELILKLKNYNISNFTHNDKAYNFCIKPDQNFINIINNINQYLIDKIDTNLTIDFSYDPTNLNLIDFERGIPTFLQGLGIVYKLYQMFIKTVKFVSTDKYATKEAIHVWHNLMTI